MSKTTGGRNGALIPGLARFLARFQKDNRANVLAIVALSMVPLVGVLSLAGEVSSWYVYNRAMQNAADSAAVAAATAGGDGNTAFQTEAQAVAKTYGFINGTNNATVTAVNGVTCPDGKVACYTVTVSRPEPLYMAGVVGYQGNTTIGSQKAELISAAATAELVPLPAAVCIIALNSNGAGLTINGAPKADLADCDILSNAQATCNGLNGSLGAGDVLYVSTQTGCTPNTQISPISDPYAGDIGTHPAGCLPLTGNILSSATILAGGCYYSTGDVTVSGTVVTNQTTPTIVYIENAVGGGAANLTGSGCITTDANVDSNCSTTADAGQGTGGLTLAFPDGGAKTGGSISQNINLNLAPPSSAFTAGNPIGLGGATIPSGITIYDPGAYGSSPINYSGNKPAWNLSGAAYFPNAILTISGVPNKAGSGYNCFILVTASVTFNGTTQLFGNPVKQCAAQGTPVPVANVGFRVAMVQ